MRVRRQPYSHLCRTKVRGGIGTVLDCACPPSRSHEGGYPLFACCHCAQTRSEKECHRRFADTHANGAGGKGGLCYPASVHSHTPLGWDKRKGGTQKKYGAPSHWSASCYSHSKTGATRAKSCRTRSGFCPPVNRKEVRVKRVGVPFPLVPCIRVLRSSVKGKGGCTA